MTIEDNTYNEPMVTFESVKRLARSNFDMSRLPTMTDKELMDYLENERLSQQRNTTNKVAKMMGVESIETDQPTETPSSLTRETKISTIREESMRSSNSSVAAATSPASTGHDSAVHAAKRVTLSAEDMLDNVMGDTVDEHDLIVRLKAIIHKNHGQADKITELLAENRRLRNVIAGMVKSLGVEVGSNDKA